MSNGRPEPCVPCRIECGPRSARPVALFSRIQSAVFSWLSRSSNPNPLHLIQGDLITRYLLGSSDYILRGEGSASHWAAASRSFPVSKGDVVIGESNFLGFTFLCHASSGFLGLFLGLEWGRWRIGCGRRKRCCEWFGHGYYHFSFH